MVAPPYQTPFWRDGELCFFAEVPAFAQIGQRFDELSALSFNYVAPAQEQQQWRQFARRLEQLISEAVHLSVESWAQVELQLEREYGDAFTQAKRRVPQPVHEYFQTLQMPLAEYAEWLLLGVEQQWALNGGSDAGLDMDLFLARTNRLSQRLQSAGYESATDRRLKQEDPDRYQFMTKSMELLLRSMDNPDPHSHKTMIDEQLLLFRQSPMFEQAQRAQNAMRQQLEGLRETHPELYEQQIRQLEKMERFAFDPVAAIRELSASEPTIPEEVVRDEIAPDQPQVAPPGHFLFRCGRRERITQSQIRLFNELLLQQPGLRLEVEAALRQMHGWMQGTKPDSWPGDRILFPDDPGTTDTPLQCFRIEHVSLDPQPGGGVVLGLDTLFGHFDEHGCCILIRDGAVKRYGTWDDVFGDEVPDEPAN